MNHRSLFAFTRFAPCWGALLVCLLLLGPQKVQAVTTFNFTLNASYTTTAGAYNSAGVLVRTIWKRVFYTSGAHTGTWDDKDDNSNTVSAGTYTIKVLFHNERAVWDGPIGNTSTNISGGSVWRGFNAIYNMAITGSTVYVALGYNEQQAAAMLFNSSNPQVKADLLNGDPFAGFSQVATDGTIAYYAAAAGTQAFTIGIKVSDGSQNVFSSGVSVQTNNGYTTYPSAIDIDNDPSNTGQNSPTGIAVQASGSYLAVSHAARGLVRLFNKTTGAAAGSITVTGPRSVAFAPSGDLWVITGTTAERFASATLGITNTPATTISGFSSPLTVAVNPTNSDIVMVADGGTSQQVKAYNSTGTSLWTYGQAGGYLTNGPVVTNDKFLFRNIVNGLSYYTSLAIASDGSFWIGDPSTCRLLHFSAARVFIEQVEYVTLDYTSTTDMNNPNRVFGGDFLEFNVDYTKPNKATNGAWTLVKNWQAGLANSAPYFGFSQGLHHVQTLSNGRTYGMLGNYSTGTQDVVELASTGIRDTGLTYVTGAILYEDGSQRWSSNNSTTHIQTFYKEALTGFDGSGNPLWGAPTILASPPSNTGDPNAAGGWTAPGVPITSSNVIVSYDNSLNAGMHLGGVALDSSGSADPWLWKASPSVLTNFPDGLGSYDIGDGIQYGGDSALSTGRNIIYGFHGEFWKQNQMSQWMHYYDDGLFVSEFGVPGNFIIYQAEPGFSGNALSSTLVNNGKETYLYHSDEGNHGALIRWHIAGMGGIQEATGSGALDSTVTLTAPAAAFPTGLAVTPGNGQVALTWNAASGATSYNVKYSTTYGGPYTAITNVSGTNYAIGGLTNDTPYFFTVSAQSASGESANADQARTFPYDPSVVIHGAGQIPFAGAMHENISSTAPAAGLPSLTTMIPDMNDLLSVLQLDNPGTKGYYVWDYMSSGTDSSTLISPFTVTTGSGWTVDRWLGGIYSIDGTSPTDNYGLYSGPTGTVNINADSNWHYLTVLSPARFSDTRNYSVKLTPQGLGSPAATYTIPNETPGLDRFFQFLFKGNVTLTVDSTGGANGTLKAIFLDNAPTPLTTPPAPTGLTATAGNAQVVLNWTAAFGATSYNVYRGTTSGGESGTAITTGVTLTTYTNTGLTNGTTYYYTVKAVNAAGTSPASNEASATPQVPAPPSPTGLTATSGNTQVVLNWATTSGATSYSIFRGTTAGGESTTAIATGITPITYTNTGLTNGTTYYYKIKAVNAGGSSGYSNEASATPQVTIPPAPTGLAASPGSTQIVLTWSASTGATTYNVYRGTTAGGESTTAIATGITPLTYTNTGLTNGTTYYYKVKAVNAGGTSGYSNEASATPTGSAPPAPTALLATPGITQVTLSWTASTGATTYNVYRGTTAGGESGTAITTGIATTSYANTGLTNGTTYFYTVKAVNASGTSTASNEASAAPGAGTGNAAIPFATTAPTIDGTVDSIWTSATAYNINKLVWGTTSDTGTWKAMWDASKLYILITVSDAALINGTTDYNGDSVEFYIDANDSKSATYGANDFQYVYGWGHASVSEYAHGATTGVTAAQVNITGGYRMEFAIPWTTLGVKPAGNAFLGFDALIDDAANTTTRAGQVTWFGTANDYLNPNLFGTGTLGAQSAPAAPTSLTGTPGNTQIALNWTASSGATTYNVYRGTTAGGESTTAIATGVAATTYTNTGLTNGTVYYYKVKAVNSVGTSGYSNEASATPNVGVATAGQFTQYTASTVTLSVTSTAPALGNPALTSGLSGLTLNSVGTKGYVIYNYGGAGVNSTNVLSPFSVAAPVGWYNDRFLGYVFQVDGVIGSPGDAWGLYSNPTGSIDVSVSDSNLHYITVVCPSRFNDLRTFTCKITPQGQTSPVASYSVTAENPGNSHVFQFSFTGNVTVTVDSSGGATGTLQAIFLD